MQKLQKQSQQSHQQQQEHQPQQLQKAQATVLSPFQTFTNNMLSNKHNAAKINWWYATAAPQQRYHQSPNQQHQEQQHTLTKLTTSSPPRHSFSKSKQNTGNKHTPFEAQQLQQQKRNNNPKQQDYQRHNPQEQQNDCSTPDSYLLLPDSKPCVGLLNPNEQDQMKVIGYRRCVRRLLLCWLCICLSGGLLRLILHWWEHWYLMATHVRCPLDEAEQVLVEEDYQGKHKIYYVKRIQLLTVGNLKQQLLEYSTTAIPSSSEFTDCDDKDMYLSVHFASAHFKQVKSLRFFTCKKLRYAWNEQTYNFVRINGLDVNVPITYFHHHHHQQQQQQQQQQRIGLSVQEQLGRRLVYGPNEIDVPYRDVTTLLFLEVLNPFYVFQIFSVILWFTYDYYYYACVIMLMSIFGISMSIIQTKKNQDALRKTVQNTGTALVVNDKGDVHEKHTQCLVPGDIIQIPTNGCTMQCDAVLLSGNCIVDESMLTGESVPITKTPLPLKRGIIYDKKDHARHTLFCGTKVIQTRYIGTEKVLAIVINTGNITAKGGLIRSVIYPPPVDYRFEQDSYKFIECLAVIALIGFSYTLFSKIMRQIDAVKIVVESLDLITIVVPPALPAAMTVGRYYAQRRLELNNIYCISPRTINVAGSIDCCCFDKTGTLTEDGLDMWGVVPKSATNQFQIPIKQIERLPYDNFLFGMVTCHSITVMNGKMVGDPLDLKMFESTGWILEDPKDIPDSQKYGLIHPTIVRQPKTTLKTKDDSNLDIVQSNALGTHSSVNDLLADVGLLNGEANNDHGIVREFPFSSNLQRMSVITRRLSDNHFSVYCKGSPEMLQQLCNVDSIPANYIQQLAIYAKQGYRIISLAHKALSPKMNYTKAQRLAREAVESDLYFLGFVILENRLKPDTSDVIRSLTAADIRTIMVTGDNILTALSVARDCGIVQVSQAVITVNVHHTPHKLRSHELYYTLELGDKDIATCVVENISTNGNGSMDANSLNSDVGGDDSVLQNSNSFSSVETYDTWTTMTTTATTSLPPHNDVELGVPSNTKSPPATSKSMHGSWRDWQQNYRFAMSGDTWQIVRENFPNELRNFVARGAIFARMSPEQKQALIMELQSLEYCVAMCGDGANDCGALKVAHTGISLSETESSIASPFTSRRPTIACVPKVIKEGRAALVTSFGIFKYMAAYSMVQFISVMILYSIDSNLTDRQYLYIDLGLISVFAFFFGKTESYDGTLARQVPLSSLISLTPLASILLHLLIVIGFQVAGWFYLHQQDWFYPFTFNPADETLACYENYTMFAISAFQYIILAFVFSKGAPYRKAIYSNIPFCLSLFINLGFVIYLVYSPVPAVANFFELRLPPVMSFRIWLLCYGICNFIAHILVEEVIVEYLLFKRFEMGRLVTHNKRAYMQVEHDLKQCCNWPIITPAIPFDENSAADNEYETMPTYVEMRASIQKHLPSAIGTNAALSATSASSSLFGFFDVEHNHEQQQQQAVACGNTLTPVAESPLENDGVVPDSTQLPHNKEQAAS